MKRLLIFLVVCFIFLLRPVYSTMGIGVSPTKLDVTFGSDNSISFKVKLINSGNTDLKITISSNLDISSDKNNFILHACECKNYCNIDVVGCDSLLPPEELTITLNNPRKPVIDYITFNGNQLTSGGMVSTGVSAKLRLSISYNGQTPTSQPSSSSNQGASTTTTIKTTTTKPSTTTTVANSVVEPSDINQSKQNTQTNNGNDDSLLYILIIGGIISIPIIGYAVYRKIRKPKEDVIPTNDSYPTQTVGYSVQLNQQSQQQYSNETEIIDETKKK